MFLLIGLRENIEVGFFCLFWFFMLFFLIFRGKVIGYSGSGSSNGSSFVKW